MDHPISPWGTKHADVRERQGLEHRLLAEGLKPAEARRQMFLALFRVIVRWYINNKKIPLDRLICACNEAIVEDVHNS